MVLPKNSKDAKGLRDFLSNLKTQMCSASEAFSEPLKKVFSEISDKFTAVIDAIPTADVPGDWSIEGQLENLFNLFTCASAAASQAGLEIAKLTANQAELARQYASKLTTEVGVEIDKLVTAGELVRKAAHTQALEGLVPQATVTQLCSAARGAGVLEGEKKVREEMTASETRRQLIATRKQGLQAASFPIPEAEVEKILGGTDEEFNTAKKLVETRQAELKTAGVQLNSNPDLLAKLWLPEDQFKIFANTVKNIPALKVVAEPLAGAGGGGNAKPPLLIV